MGRRRVRIRIRRGEKGAVSPAVAFAVLVVVLATALIGFALLEKDDEDGRPAPSPAGTVPTDEEDLSLTDAEAIARFKELDRLRIEALEQRDLALIGKLYTSDSPALQRGKKSIRQLRRTGVRVDERWELEQVTIDVNTTDEIKVVAVGVSAARFFDAGGNDVTKTSPRERHTVECVLRPEEQGWVIHDCLITAVDPL